MYLSFIYVLNWVLWHVADHQNRLCV